jgi:aerobic-type carbon monoxide dehydrogenase small subunit (CoxS/CutS family)
LSSPSPSIPSTPSLDQSEPTEPSVQPQLQPSLTFSVDGHEVEVADDGSTLLVVLREQLGLRTPKDGCSPQGQCGCCTVLVDGQPRVACVTPARRVRGRSITTLDGLPDDVRTGWGDAFCASGASQCGFCTPGIVLRLDALRAKGAGPDDLPAVENALLAHLCRCTGWRTILDAWSTMTSTPVALPPSRDLDAAARRAAIEGRSVQVVSPDVALGHGGFADDQVADGALVAVSDETGGWTVGETLAEARAASGKVQGRRTTTDPVPPLELPPGDWDVTLRTSWVEPAYLETDASWCVPGGESASPLANGGAFGGKLASVVMAAARDLAGEHGRPVRVLLSREDAVRLGPKRPPIAAGTNADGTGVIRVIRTPGIADAIAAVAPGLAVEEVDAIGPSTASGLRAAGWAEALVLLAAAAHRSGGDGGNGRNVDGGEVEITSPDGATAWARVTSGPDAKVTVRVRCGEPLDEVALRSYCVGAAHMALGWVSSEGLAVDDEGEIHDLTIRSFGVLRAVDTPPIEVTIEPDEGPPVNGSDAVFAAVAAATWIAQGTPTDWPTGIRVRG